ncbi:hypothetical protein SAMN04489727_2041 [Amycolatopsis tolypomycina]|uniref:Uncharacterized protein n=1 Tax=Amycolatopsis tolypomycina TaxID=208445 RepID=A0A1H4JPH0_9PSEU|nr:hypothetical protein SAMN04489727_2041 [Amycolatopsis tolypomycina]
MPDAETALTRPAAVATRPTGQASSVSGFPPAGLEGGAAPHPPTARGNRRPAVPPHLSYSGGRRSSTCRYRVDRHLCGDASDPTAHRARPSRSPSAGQSVSTVLPGARRAPHPRSAIRAHGDDVAAGGGARGLCVTDPASATTLRMRCDPIGATRSRHRLRGHPRTRLPVRARGNAACRRCHVGLRCRRLRHGASIPDSVPDSVWLTVGTARSGSPRVVVPLRHAPAARPTTSSGVLQPSVLSTDTRN